MARTMRKRLDHTTHFAGRFGAIYFITICCQRRGSNQLCHDETATVVANTARVYHERARWNLNLLLLMPDHLHALIGVDGQTSLAQLIRDYKRITAKIAGVRWQRNFFDHRLRHDESLTEKFAYICQNPVRAGRLTTIAQRIWPRARRWTSRSSFARISSVKLPVNAAIAPEKLTKYLLVRQARGDKSAFLAEAGYTAANPDQLLDDLRRQVLPKEAILIERTKFGELYEIRALLTGPNGTALRIRSIWMKEHLSDVTKFITLVPDRKR